MSRIPLAYLAPYKTKSRSSPERAKFAKDLQTSCLAAHALHGRCQVTYNPSHLLLGPPVNHTAEKFTASKLKLCWDQKGALKGRHSDLIITPCYFNTVPWILPHTQFPSPRKTMNSVQMYKCKNTFLLLVDSKINTTRSTCD